MILLPRFSVLSCKLFALQPKQSSQSYASNVWLGCWCAVHFYHTDNDISHSDEFLKVHQVKGQDIKMSGGSAMAQLVLKTALTRVWSGLQKP